MLGCDILANPLNGLFAFWPWNGDPKVNEFGGIALGNQNVLRREISVRYSKLGCSFEGGTNLQNKCHCALLWQRACLRNELVERNTIDTLGGDPQRFLVSTVAKNFGDTWVVETLELL